MTVTLGLTALIASPRSTTSMPSSGSTTARRASNTSSSVTLIPSWSPWIPTGAELALVGEQIVVSTQKPFGDGKRLPIGFERSARRAIRRAKSLRGARRRRPDPGSEPPRPAGTRRSQQRQRHMPVRWVAQAPAAPHGGGYELVVNEPQLGPLSRDPPVAGQREVDPTTHRVTVDDAKVGSGRAAIRRRVGASRGHLSAAQNPP